MSPCLNVHLVWSNFVSKMTISNWSHFYLGNTLPMKLQSLNLNIYPFALTFIIRFLMKKAFIKQTNLKF